MIFTPRRATVDLEMDNIQRWTLDPSLPKLQLTVTELAPAKPQDGQIAYADGVSWNPGLGQGFYGYYGAAWNRLG